MQFIQEAAGPEAHVIFGYGIDETLGDTLQVTVIATGFKGGQTARPAARVAAAPVAAAVEPAPAPAPEPEPARQAVPVPAPEVEDFVFEHDPEPEQAEPRPEAEPQPRFVSAPEPAPEPEPAERALAAAAGADQEFLVRAPKHPAATAAPPQDDLFLRRVGRRNIAEIEVPGGGEPLVAPERSVASGFGPDRTGEDLSAPAYSRKYMD